MRARIVEQSLCVVPTCAVGAQLAVLPSRPGRSRSSARCLISAILSARMCSYFWEGCSPGGKLVADVWECWPSTSPIQFVRRLAPTCVRLLESLRCSSRVLSDTQYADGRAHMRPLWSPDVPEGAESLCVPTSRGCLTPRAVEHGPAAEWSRAVGGAVRALEAS
eukprot:2618195-Pyramimonas_sp.AAC.1